MRRKQKLPDVPTCRINDIDNAILLPPGMMVTAYARSPRYMHSWSNYSHYYSPAFPLQPVSEQCYVQPLHCPASLAISLWVLPADTHMAPTDQYPRFTRPKSSISRSPGREPGPGTIRQEKPWIQLRKTGYRRGKKLDTAQKAWLRTRGVCGSRR
ncbi:hypothetical protein Bbelb_357900 [Branchiostoma belcheri]|nr:hypothetical protein Bbelb_357900 [Branchiostoma belcheri]